MACNQMGAPASKTNGLLYNTCLIGIWIFLSSAVIFYNKYILTTLAFPYPITLTATHLIFQVVATRLLKRFVPARFSKNQNVPVQQAAPVYIAPETNKSGQDASISIQIGTGDAPARPDNELGFTPDIYWKKLVPIGVLFAASLYLSNLVYLYLSVTTIQMIKSGSPIAVLLSSFAFGLRQPTLRLISIILLICAGVAIASYGAIDFNLFGFGIQALAIAIEATRLSLIQTLLHGLGMTPIASLYAFAPVCLVTLACLLLPVEGLAPIYALPSLGIHIILLNTSMTFLLNLASIELINLSSLVLSLAKVVKDVLLILGGALLLGEAITSLQLGGYLVALIGLILFKMYG